ncbi:hypothetical protein PUNSTDRAFT_146229 [Punctularia strigosozonata HHB-11173 SS5]|uniref:Uncharacterized protein n=1 Tax=Punctularia strigosozonata (strain HHB-11173) TaxID=741275 RepID=R7S3G7_PUNST|nr:uncharacterized protein PUNSTDRAFT_146229 [Punctularia strigosozonata HHB-11173 SS5]EIN04955.1 hypothetical protein PUNSTDRAFT_146229 [Punctularia strigosozonata HHB-11173 SS5]
MFKSLAITISLAVGSFSLVTPIVPHEGAYSVNNLDGLTAEPTDLTTEIATQLLDILEKYDLTSAFGVVGVHNHMTLAPGQVAFQTGNATATHVEIAEYSAVKSEGVPYNYRITPTGDLLPLDLGSATSDALAARTALGAATSSGSFLKEFAQTAAGHLAGVAYIRPLDRAALTNGAIVKNHYNAAKTEGVAAPIAAVDADPEDAPSFWTRGISNSTAPADITILCSICGHGNPWADRRAFAGDL